MKAAPLLASILGVVLGSSCTWDRCNPNSADTSVLNVHLVTHSHDDLGWLITVDQYYEREVQSIYDTVVEELEKDPTRRFSFAETGFLMRWVEARNASTVQRLQNLVKNGQLEIIGGGWVQNDEAASHYVDIIDQMTLGFEHLSKLFGECGAPKAAWQIDPFGHSREFANLAAQMGMSSLWFARIHYIDREARHSQKTNEMTWSASDDLRTSILTGAFYSHYSPLSGFCFDTGCHDEEIQEYNVERRANEFAQKVRDQASHYRTNNVMLTMGDDFQYQHAYKWFNNLDKLIKYINSNPSYKLNVQYSTPACYASALTQSRAVFSTKKDDFFPYASGDHSFWTGYFTSRPAFKGMIRQASSYLNLAKQLTGQFLLNSDSALEVMKRASGLAQHHDSITGTAKQAVTYDYEQRLDKGIGQLATIVNEAFKESGGGGGSAPGYSLCLLANETVCEISKQASVLAVTVYNPLAQSQSTVVRIPFYHSTADVKDYNGQPTNAQLMVTPSIPTLQSSDSAPYELHLPVSIEPLGYRTYFISGSSEKVSENHISADESVLPENSDVVSIENDKVSLQFDSNGYLQSVLDKTTNVRRNLKQEFFYYESMGDIVQPSGAYVFRPSKQSADSVGTSVQVTVTKGAYVQEVRQKVSDWIYQTIRLYANQSQIEFDWVVGPIPKEPIFPTGKEVITRYTTDINSKGVFYTDASGRQMLKRTLNSYPSFKYDNTEPVSGNYYPVNNRVFINDANSQLTVLTDRAEGGTSTNGGIELMLHRRCFHDDHFGVGENLDEPGKDGKGLVARGVHWVLIGDAQSAASVHRPLATRLFHRPIPLFASIQDINSYRTNFITRYSGLTRELPPNVNLLTLEKRGDSQVLLRLEHIFQNSEDPKLSQPVQVDFSKLFVRLSVSNVQELTLGANQNASGTSSVVTLNPQEIKTFLVTVQKRGA